MVRKFSVELEKFLNKYSLIKLKKGEIVYRPNEPEHLISILKSGFARIYSVSNQGKENTLFILGPHSPISFLPLAKEQKTNIILKL